MMTIAYAVDVGQVIWEPCLWYIYVQHALNRSMLPPYSGSHPIPQSDYQDYLILPKAWLFLLLLSSQLHSLP